MEQGNSGVGTRNQHVQLAQVGFAVEGAEQVHVGRTQSEYVCVKEGRNEGQEISLRPTRSEHQNFVLPIH